MVFNIRFVNLRSVCIFPSSSTTHRTRFTVDPTTIMMTNPSFYNISVVIVVCEQESKRGFTQADKWLELFTVYSFQYNNICIRCQAKGKCSMHRCRSWSHVHFGIVSQWYYNHTHYMGWEVYTSHFRRMYRFTYQTILSKWLVSCIIAAHKLMYTLAWFQNYTITTPT